MLFLQTEFFHFRLRMFIETLSLNAIAVLFFDCPTLDGMFSLLMMNEPSQLSENKLTANQLTANIGINRRSVVVDP